MVLILLRSFEHFSFSFVRSVTPSNLNYLPLFQITISYLCNMSVTQTDATADAPPEILFQRSSRSRSTQTALSSPLMFEQARGCMEECRRWRDTVLSDPFIWDHLVANVAWPVEEFPLLDIPSTIRYGPDGVDFTKEVQRLRKRHLRQGQNKLISFVCAYYISNTQEVAHARWPYGNRES
ncbi:uncharacterized protein ARMOST_15042 [Armillaria ostoyae]|uniref:Uncharacterized protein n=1 Tax=Armillaria ostoyae TaxID=47428 RepID=A0A284RSA0_ARMOS|nr:uncharacterized protein ARMOST_15042 [Armillaria ostoyae]